MSRDCCHSVQPRWGKPCHQWLPWPSPPTFQLGWPLCMASAFPWWSCRHPWWLDHWGPNQNCLQSEKHWPAFQWMSHWYGSDQLANPGPLTQPGSSWCGVPGPFHSLHGWSRLIHPHTLSPMQSPSCSASFQGQAQTSWGQLQFPSWCSC